MTIAPTTPNRSKGSKDTKDSETKKRKSSKKGDDVETIIESSSRRRTRSNICDNDDDDNKKKKIEDTKYDDSPLILTPNNKEVLVGVTPTTTRSSTGKRTRSGAHATTTTDVSDHVDTGTTATTVESKSEKQAKKHTKHSSEKREKKARSSETKRTPLQLQSDPPNESPSKKKKSPRTKHREDSANDATTTTASPMVTTNEDDFDPTSTMMIQKSQPTMDVLVHRLRHFNYHPKPIVAMASTSVFYHNDSTSASSGRTSNNITDDSMIHAVNGATTTTTTTTNSTGKHQQPPDSYIAVSRESGSIELHTIHPKWRAIGIIAGHLNTPITLLTWVQGPEQEPLPDDEYDSYQIPYKDGISSQQPVMHQHRQNHQRPILVGVNGSDLYIVDFWDRQQLVSKYACPGGNIFSIQHLYGNVIAIGSQDGTIRILSVEVISSSKSSNRQVTQSYQFELVSTIPTTGAAVVSLACIVNTAHIPGLVGTILFAGVADGTIRRYDCHPIQDQNHLLVENRSNRKNITTTNTTWKSTLRMTVECYGRSTPTVVWTMKALSDGTVVSGDSLGHVQFWDGLTGTLISTFDQNENKADVLALDVTSDECKVFTSGIDSRVVCIERQKMTGADSSGNSKWIMTHAQRPHTHDVKAMTIMKKFKINHSGKITKETEILFTGGIDTKLCTYHVSEFGLRRPRSLYPWPSLHSPIVAANQAKILTMLRENHVDLYELATAPSSPKQVHTPIIAPDDETLIGTIEVKRSSNLSCCAISMDGTFLALCDSYNVFLFQLQIETTKDDTKKVTASTIPITLPKGGSNSIVAVQFIQSSHLVLATSQSTIHIYSLEKSEVGYRTTPTQTFSPSNTGTSRKAWLLPINSIMCSTDGVWIATTRNSYDQSDGVVDIYRSASDGYQFWWSLPTLNTAVTAVSFLELLATPMIAVACVNFSWYTFDLSKRSLSDWSVQAGYPIAPNKIPNDLSARNDYPIRISTNPANPSTLLIVRI